MQVAVPRRAISSPAGSHARLAFVACVVGTVAQQAVSAQPTQHQPAPQSTPALVVAQVPRQVILSGSVRDSTGARIPFATVRWQAGSIVANDSGAFEVRDVLEGPTKFSVRRIGFEPVDFEATVSATNPREVIVEMRPIAMSMTSVNVDADPDDMRGARLVRLGFFDRRRNGRGTFFGPEEIERRQPQALSDIVANAPGVTIVGRRRSRGLQYYTSGGCKMNVFLDGHEVTDLGDDVLNGSDIKAIEIYNNATSAPPQFVTWDLRKGYCGSVVVWTK